MFELVDVDLRCFWISKCTNKTEYSKNSLKRLKREENTFQTRTQIELDIRIFKNLSNIVGRTEFKHEPDQFNRSRDKAMYNVHVTVLQFLNMSKNYSWVLTYSTKWKTSVFFMNLSMYYSIFNISNSKSTFLNHKKVIKPPNLIILESLQSENSMISFEKLKKIFE